MNQPTVFQCVDCGVDVLLFPTGTTEWGPVKESYARCGLDVPEPTCGECVIQRVRDEAELSTIED